MQKSKLLRIILFISLLCIFWIIYMRILWGLPYITIFLWHLYLLTIAVLFHLIFRIDIGLHFDRRLLLESILIGIIFGVIGIILEIKSIPNYALVFLSRQTFESEIYVALHLFKMWFWIGFTEEALFRGVIQTLLLMRFPRQIKIHNYQFKVGTILAGLIFGLVHIINVFGGLPLCYVICQVIAATAFGIAVGYIYQETRSIFTTSIAHNLANGITSVIYFL